MPGHWRVQFDLADVEGKDPVELRAVAETGRQGIVGNLDVPVSSAATGLVNGGLPSAAALSLLASDAGALPGKGTSAMTSNSRKHVHSHIPAPPREAGFSLLRLSAAQRIGLVLVVVALLWGGVFWALS